MKTGFGKERQSTGSGCAGLENPGQRYVASLFEAAGLEGLKMWENECIWFVLSPAFFGVLSRMFAVHSWRAR